MENNGNNVWHVFGTIAPSIGHFCEWTPHWAKSRLLSFVLPDYEISCHNEWSDSEGHANYGLRKRYTKL